MGTGQDQAAVEEKLSLVGPSGKTGRGGGPQGNGGGDVENGKGELVAVDSEEAQ